MFAPLDVATVAPTAFAQNDKQIQSVRTYCELFKTLPGTTWRSEAQVPNERPHPFHLSELIPVLHWGLVRTLLTKMEISPNAPRDPSCMV